MTADLVRSAALNNAQWCDAVCRTHGLDPSLGSDAWTSARRTPPLYPDAVTLQPSCSAVELLSRVDMSAGCSVKDSFADLDLSAWGFSVLFGATWIALVHHLDVHRASIEWRLVDTAAELDEWSLAWDPNGLGHDLFRPALLDDPRVSVVAGQYSGSIVAGAILFREAGVIGLTNYFELSSVDALGGCLAMTRLLEPELTIVGYEHGPSLTAALAHGFRAIGPLRVWTTQLRALTLDV
jgi:hypothetical protein